MANWREARRGKYSVGFKKRVVAEALVSGASVSKIARAHGLNANMIFGWRKDPRFQPPEKKRKAVEAALAVSGTKSSLPLAEEPVFLPIEVACATALVEPVMGGGSQSVSEGEPSRISITSHVDLTEPMGVGGTPSPSGRIELVLANGHRLLLSGNVDAEAVLRLARGLAQGASL